MPEISTIAAILLQILVSIVVSAGIYALLSKSLWYNLSTLAHEIEVVRAQVTREVKVRAADTRHSGGKVDAQLMKDLIALQANQNAPSMSREDIIERGRRGA